MAMKVVDPEYVDPMAKFMEEVFVDSTLNRAAFELIENVHQSYNGKVIAGLIYAPTDYGKTATILYYIRKYMELFKEHNPHADLRPIIHISLPSNCTIKRFYGILLEALGDIDPTYGDIEKRKKRVADLCKKLKVTLIIVDEFNRLLKSPGRPTNLAVAREIQTMINVDLKIPMLLVGLDTCREIFDSLHELSRRIPEKYDIRKHECHSPLGSGRFTIFLESIERLIPGGSVRISGPDMAPRFYHMSNGVPGRIMTLIQYARMNSIAKNEPLTLDDYRRAFLRIYRLESRSQIGDRFEKYDIKEGEEIYKPLFNSFDPAIDPERIEKLIGWRSI